MKKIRFSIIALAALLVLGSCTKHKLWFPMDEMPKDGAEFQLHYFEPINNVAANNIDSVYINGTLYSSKDGGGSLLPYNGVPCMDVGKFFYAPAGSVNIRLMRGGETIYDRNTTLEAKKQNVFIHDLNEDPIVVDNRYPYWNDRGVASTAATFGDDSVCKVMFVNLLYESPGVPYSGKLQYQYKRNDAGDDEPWNNIGDPVGFGEGTERTLVLIHYEGGPTSNYYKSQRENYRILDENGDILQVLNSAGTKMIDYSDWWTARVGKVYMHIFRGYRTAKPVCGVTQWTSL
ncbi:MAG: hypothetical protein J6Y40_01170 [Bacteroidales bacterium]|nr:hypothetical protein [Bacteroidales bacterium]